mmetsp:Transcript_55614/g.153992  ORF Transcript_55614/g.153992 Transcript_55614/m.153992 type:complete len:221 (-) Transcript_55614:7-669(-)
MREQPTHELLYGRMASGPLLSSRLKCSPQKATLNVAGGGQEMAQSMRTRHLAPWPTACANSGAHLRRPTAAADRRRIFCGPRRLRRPDQDELEDPPASALAEQAAAPLHAHLAVPQIHRAVRPALHELCLEAAPSAQHHAPCGDSEAAQPLAASLCVLGVHLPSAVEPTAHIAEHDLLALHLHCGLGVPPWGGGRKRFRTAPPESLPAVQLFDERLRPGA